MNKAGIKKNTTIEVEITGLSDKGAGIAKVDGFPVFVEDALVGEGGTVYIYRLENTYALARWEKQETKSKDRLPVSAKNKILTSLIPLQHLKYEKQLEFKTSLVKEALSKIKDFDEDCLLDTLGMENQWHYRNKAQVHVHGHKNTMETGVITRRPHRLVGVDNFKVNLPGMDEIILGVRDILTSFKEKGYNPKTHTGNIRQIILRKGYATDQTMVIIVTRSKSLFPKSKILPAILEQFPNVVSVIHSMNSDKNNQGSGSIVEVLYGEASYQDNVLGNTFDIGVNSYFKGNTLQAEVLVTSLMDLLELKGDEVLLDANSSIGMMALSLAGKVKSLVGIDRSCENVELAKTNAEKNNIENVSFHCANIKEVIQSSKSKFDILIANPSNKGLDSQDREAIIEGDFAKIVYISDDLPILTKDLQQLIEVGYVINKVVPIDMLPQTTHVECVVLIEKE